MTTPTETTSTRRRREIRDGRGVLGLGIAACAACCAGPVLTLLGGVTILGFASTTVIGLGGLAIGTVALVALLVIRRRRAVALVPADEPVRVDLMEGR